MFGVLLEEDQFAVRNLFIFHCRPGSAVRSGIKCDYTKREEYAQSKFSFFYRYADVWMIYSIWIQIWTHMLNPAWVEVIEVRKVSSASLSSKAPELCHWSKFLMKEHRKLTQHCAFVSSLTISWETYRTVFSTVPSDWNTRKFVMIKHIQWVKCSHPFSPVS